MKITFIAPTVNLGGGTRVIVIYAQALMRMGHDVSIISTPPRSVPRRQKLKSWLLGIDRLSEREPQSSHLDGSGVEHHILDRWRPIADEDVPDGDVVIATWWETAEWVDSLAASKGTKVYFIQHHEIFPYLPIERVRATYRLPMHKIVIAQWLRKVMSTEYGDDIIDVVPNSVDRTQFFAPVRGKQRDPTVGFLYSTVPFKGLDVAIAAIRIVHERRPDLRMVSFGSHRPIAECALPTCADFYLCPRQDQIRNLYSRCDVWITASRSEGFNLPAMEAMACRTPVVATRTGWPEEAVEAGWNGFLVDIDDPAGLAKAVNSVLSNSDEDWRTLSSNAYATVASSSWRASAEMFERALHHACLRAARGEIGGSSAPSSEPEIASGR